ncbi:hypothetical protein [Streptomyces sp. KS 21]|uniref:hypothetical protein n=1 Tax=Streptomyces sp. KS 21 TaxID=2485150 RepID=UPI0010628D4F|nr:hypothetical protein [Streptomyces sp. KS 21]TDU74603.1 hypothetical protein EDD91_1247 [Streptomyces sp. KS 21]
MSTNRFRRIDHDTAEQLLGRHVAGAQDGHEALAGLLSAAAGPASEAELSGEQAARAAFRAAQLAPAPVPVPQRPRRQPMATSALAKVLSAKVAAAAAATALGGVAVAAGTGHLPAALGGGPDDDRPARAEAAVSASPSPAARPNAAGRTAAPLAADLAELCRAYGRARDAHPGEAPAEPRFAVLVTAAGGPDSISEYCAPVLAAPSSPGAAPAATDRPAESRPSGRPTSRPRPPDNRPAGPGAGHTPNAPESHPTGPPDGRPAVPPDSGGDPAPHPRG